MLQTFKSYITNLYNQVKRRK